MKYTFDLVGVSPVLSFFNYEQDQQQQRLNSGAQYLGAYQCTLDAFIQSVETVPVRRGWQLDEVVDSVINFWLNNADQVCHWRRRLEDAGSENLLVARLADLNALKTEFESLFSDL
ncbi:MAG: hypothetical protein SFY66_07175 [Oculatellaceae cyanobacterium bins.114]|nr:hypothetical protein [Oculatellaceae cyanobacterium bins.114]